MRSGLEAVLIPVLLCLIGHYLGGTLSRKGDGLTELVLLRVALGVAVSTPVLVALALLGWFMALAVIICLAACAAASWALARLCGGGTGDRIATRPSFRDLLALGLVAGALALYAHPAEYVIKDRDPGLYTVVAAKLARTGELLTRDPLVAAVAPFHEFEFGAKYPGFFINGEDLLVPQFFPGAFVWPGLGNLLGGVWGGLYVVPLFGALSAGMAFVLGRELFGSWAGLLGAVLLATSYAQVWWARYPCSEGLTQFFILAGLWCGARFSRGGGRGTGFLAGALLGGAMLVRIDAVLAALAVPALVGYDLLLGRPPRRWLPVCAPLFLLGGAAALYAGTLGERYLDVIRDLHVPESLIRLSPYLLPAVALLVVTLWVLRRRREESLRRLLTLHRRNVALLAAVVLLGLALWAYFILPQPWEGLPEHWGGPADRMENFHAYDAQVAVRMVWFITPVVAALGMAGLVLAAYRLNAARALFLGAVVAFGSLYVALPNVAPDLPWSTRRFVPVVFPGLSLLAGYAVVEAGRVLARIWGVRVGAFAATALAVVALSWSVSVAWQTYGVRELAGAVEGLDRLNRAIPEARVVYVELPGDDYAATLDYLYGRPVLAYDREQFREELPDLREAGLLESAVYVTVEERQKPVLNDVRLREVGREEVSFSRLEDGFKDVPREAYEERQGFRVYEVERN